MRVRSPKLRVSTAARHPPTVRASLSNVKVIYTLPLAPAQWMSEPRKWTHRLQLAVAADTIRVQAEAFSFRSTPPLSTCRHMSLTSWSRWGGPWPQETILHTRSIPHTLTDGRGSLTKRVMLSLPVLERLLLTLQLSSVQHFFGKTNWEQYMATSVKILCYSSSQAETGHYGEQAWHSAD